MNLNKFNLEAVLATGYAVALQIIGAIVLFIVGRWLINFVIKLVNAGLKRQSFDPIVAGYIGSALQVLLNIILVISLLAGLAFKRPPLRDFWRRRSPLERRGAGCWRTLRRGPSLLCCARSNTGTLSAQAG